MKLRIITGDISRRAMLVPLPGRTILNWGLGRSANLTLTGQLTSVELVNQTNTRDMGKTAGGALVGGALAGPLGAIAGGVISGKGQSLTVQCQLLDGRTFTAEVDQQAYQTLLACMTGNRG